MDITPQDTTQQPISDDQELAKALAGVVPETSDPNPVAEIATELPGVPAMQFEETPAPIAAPAPVAAPVASALPPVETVVQEAPVEVEIPSLPTFETPAPTLDTQSSGDLEGIKHDALSELRPLIDKVDLPAEEKFDTYLMLIRSTDDSTLIGPAHQVAQTIVDEKRRAEALLDIIKEIDFLSHTEPTL